MALDESKKEDFKAKLRSMTDEEIRLALDMGTIALEWKRSLAEQELEHRAQQSDLALARQRIAELETELSETRTELSSARTGSVWLRWQTISGWVVAAIMLLALFF